MNYQYSLKFSLGTIALMLLLMLMLLSNVMWSDSTLDWAVYTVFTVVFLSLITLLVIKRLIPAIKGSIALTVDEQGLNDYIRDVSIAWADIESIILMRGRSAASLCVDLKWESDYGKSLTIPLRWIKGKDEEIYNTIMGYFERSAEAAY